MTILTQFWRVLLCGTVAAILIYFVLHRGGADDAGFFVGFLTVALVVAALASPKKDIRRGLQSLHLIDWIPSAVMPAIILSMSPSEPLIMTVARYVCFLVFFSHLRSLFGRGAKADWGGGGATGSGAAGSSGGESGGVAGRRGRTRQCNKVSIR